MKKLYVVSDVSSKTGLLRRKKLQMSRSGEGTLAESEFANEREEMLRLLTLLNSSVIFIGLRLRELAANKILAPEYLDRLSKVTKEVETYLSKTR